MMLGWEGVNMMSLSKVSLESGYVTAYSVLRAVCQYTV